jgi:hypothetical protein
MVFSDPHYTSPNDNFRESILYELTLAAIEEQVEFVFITGDLILRNGGEGADYDSLQSDWKFILDTLDVHGIRLYACRGNNDVYSSEAWAALFSGKHALPDNGPEEEKYYTYSFTYDNFMFMSLDQYTNYNLVNQSWIDEQLTNNDKPFVFAASHEPAFKIFWSGLSFNPDERDTFWTSLSNHNGKIYFCGHSHFYDHSLLIDEDDYPDNDVHQMVVGTGGAGFHIDSSYSSENGRWEIQNILHEKSFGYVLVNVSESGFQTKWKHRVAPFEFEEGGDNYSYDLTPVSEESQLPADFVLFQNYPNPFNPNTTIKYSIPSFKSPLHRRGFRGGLSHVKLVVYDLLGKEVATLVNEHQRPGPYEVKWDASNQASGVYFYKLTAGSYSKTRKMVLLR